MRKLITVFIIFMCINTIDAQSLNLVTGTTITNDRRLFNDKSLSPNPMVFFKVGLGYTAINDVSISLDYTLDINMLSVTTVIPIWDLGKSKNKRKTNIWN